MFSNPCRWTFCAFLAASAAPADADDLLGLYREAIVADATFLSARADTAAQRETLPQARAQLLPNLSFSGTRGKNTTEQTSESLLGPVTSERDYDSHNYVLSLRQPLFRPYNFAAYQQARARVDSADASLAWAAQDVAVRVGSAYFDALLARSELDVNQAQQDAYAAQLAYAEKNFAAGYGTRTDIDEARSRLDLAQAQALELKHRLEYLQDALSALVDRPLTPLARLDPIRLELVNPDPDRLEDWAQEAETVNPQLQTLRARVEAAEQEVWKARSGHLPTLDLVAQRSRSESESNTSIGVKYDTRMVGIQLNIPLYSGGHVNSTVRQALSELERQRQQLEAARRDIRLEIRKEFDTATQGVQWVRAYEQAVRSAEQTLFSTKKGFQAGKRNTLDILNAEQSLAAAHRDLNRSRYQYLLARLRLLSLVGRLDDAEMTRFNACLTPDDRDGKAVEIDRFRSTPVTGQPRRPEEPAPLPDELISLKGEVSNRSGSDESDT